MAIIAQNQPKLTGWEEESSELICFKVYKTQVPVIERSRRQL
jgi:hypothetical protein